MNKLILMTAVLFSVSSWAQISETMPLPEALTMPCAMNILNGKMIFVANSSVHGKELWTTDGTLEGTTLLKEINNDYNIAVLSAFTYTNSQDAEGYFGILNDSKMFFQATSTYGGTPTLWVTDGTTDGTTRFTIPGAALLDVRWFKEFNGRLYFTARTVANGIEIWSTDGTVAGTSMLKEINPGNGNAFETAYNPGFFIHNNKLWFKANDGTHGIELWSTDGTAAGTSMLFDLHQGSTSDPANKDAFKWGTVYNDRPFVNVGNYFYFAAYVNWAEYGGYQLLFKSDGTASGTVPVDAAPTLNGSIPKYYSPSPMTMLDGNAYFFSATIAYDGGTQSGLWKLNPQTQAITFVKSVSGYGDNGLSDGLPKGAMREFNGKLYFIGKGAGDDYHFWSTDGTANGTQKIFQPNNSSIDSFNTQVYMRSIVFEGKLYFVGGRYASENVYSTDGTTAGTLPVFSTTMVAGPYQFTKFGSDQGRNSNETNRNTPSASLYFATSHNLTYEMWRLRQDNSMAIAAENFKEAKVYPNPSKGMVNLSLKNEISNGKVQLVNLMGQELFNKNNLEGKDFHFDFSGQPSGIYMLHLQSDSGNLTQKILLQ